MASRGLVQGGYQRGGGGGAAPPPPAPPPPAAGGVVKHCFCVGNWGGQVAAVGEFP